MRAHRRVLYRAKKINSELYSDKRAPIVDEVTEEIKRLLSMMQINDSKENEFTRDRVGVE